MVEVIEGLGHTVEYPEGQTCCGQPPFNSGYWEEARVVARRQLEFFRDAEVVVEGFSSSFSGVRRGGAVGGGTASAGRTCGTICRLRWRKWRAGWKGNWK
jgi:hypothetical protein